MVHLQIARPQGDGFGDALGDDPSLDSRQVGERNGGAVVGVEALSLDQAGAVESEASLTARLRRLFQILGSAQIAGFPGVGKIQILPSVRTPST